MTTPTLTIEGIIFDGTNSHDILLWVNQDEKAGVDRRGLYIHTISGTKRVREGDTVVRVMFNDFAVINHRMAAVKS